MKFIKNRPFKATVKVVYPGIEVTADNSFVGHFIAFDRDTLKGMALGTPELEDAYLDKVFMGWEGLVNSDDAPFDVNPENRIALLGDMAVRAALFNTFVQELAGQRRGN
jgi:hypothetical protein